MHDKGKVGLGLRCQNPSWRKPRVVYQKRIGIAIPLDGIWRIRHDGLKGLITPMHGMSQRIPMRDIELVVVDIMQEHIDATEVIGGDVYFLSVEAQTDVLLAENFGELE